MCELPEVLAIFAMSEEEQETYFPPVSRDVAAIGSQFELCTRHTRKIALCVLAEESLRGEVAPGEYGNLCREIASLASLMIESTADYDWLVWHPRLVRLETTSIVDPLVYDVWEVIRRLCREANKIRPLDRGCPRPFAEAFRSFLYEITLDQDEEPRNPCD